jgi:hypothetical protein
VGKQLTLSQPDYAHHSTTSSPGFSDLATALHCKNSKTRVGDIHVDIALLVNIHEHILSEKGISERHELLQQVHYLYNIYYEFSLSV